MGEALVSQSEHEGREESRDELLVLQILDIECAVLWGIGVAEEQRLRMRSIWTRCATDGNPEVQLIPRIPTSSHRFTASVALRLRQRQIEYFDLGASTFEELAETLTSRLTLEAILANAGQLTMLHACGVADPVTGSTVALVAKSGTGKTTAASVLARAYGYVTDETVAIRHDGSVVPYAKPLSVKQEAGDPKRQVGPDELGLMPAPTGTFLQSVVLLNRVAGKQIRPVMERVPLTQGILALIPDSSSQGELDQPLQSFCRLIDSVGGVWQVTYSEAEDLPLVLAPLFCAQPQRTPEWQPRVTHRATNIPVLQDHLQRTTVKDVVAIGEHLLLMLDSGIVQLSGIGPTIWEAAESPVRPRQLAEEVAKVHGTPEGYRDAVANAVAELVAAGVLQYGY
jgi:hypothetical protein